MRVNNKLGPRRPLVVFVVWAAVLASNAVLVVSVLLGVFGVAPLRLPLLGTQLTSANRADDSARLGLPPERLYFLTRQRQHYGRLTFARRPHQSIRPSWGRLTCDWGAKSAPGCLCTPSTSIGRRQSARNVIQSEPGARRQMPLE